ncbi:hypothetical protein BDZ94DRAFT_1356243 [Collybia nuda]|uniref:Uncharacterized protein n=1 Tax=Collybia nuda TaxID=64659 RepID=A0A9P6CKN7_9AGAR|nr:hypothetical protein BDZ94DRAFT_1356243 [Collybia nuda]
MPKKEPSRRSTRISNTLDVSDLVLTTVRDAASVSAIPYFKDAADLSLGILAIVKGARDNKESFARLAADACGLVYAVLCRHKGETLVQPQDLDGVRELLKTLSSIERFAMKETSRNFFIRMIRHKSDQGKIQEFRETLRQSLDVFGLQSSLSIQDNIQRLINQQVELMSELQGQQEKLQLERARTEGGRSVTGKLANQVALNLNSEPHGSPVSINVSSSNALRKEPRPPFPNIHSSHGSISITTVDGNQVTTDASHHITNTNSGNTTNTTITGSDNNSSVRTYGGRRGKRNYI